MADPMLTEREHDLIVVLRRLANDIEAALPYRYFRSKAARETFERVRESAGLARAVLERIEPAPAEPKE